MQNFLNYIKLEGKQTFNTLEELKELKFKKKRTLSSSLIWYSLLLRCNSLQTCQLLMKEFPFPSLSPLKKYHRGTTCALKCATPLKSQGVISEDIVLMFNKMYLQKCEECSGGEIIGASEHSLKTLKNCGFRVREIVSDNPSASVLAYKLLLKESGHLDDHLFIQYYYQKIYLLHAMMLNIWLKT